VKHPARNLFLALAAAALGLVLMFALPIVLTVRNSETIVPTDSFVAAMGSDSVVPGSYIPPGAPPLNQGMPCAAARRRLAGSSEFDLLICDPPPGSAVAMQLQVEKVLHRGLLGTESSRGAPRLLCDLNVAQAAFVRRFGVPPTLMEAMENATAGVSWEGWYGTAPTPGDVRIDPGPHFP
jgi:hypothetical protein